MDIVTALERTYDGTGKLVANLTPEAMSAPTPCPGWDVRAALDHLLGVMWMFTRAAHGEPIPESLQMNLVGDDPTVSLEAAVRASLEAWRRPGALAAPCGTPLGMATGEFAVSLNCMEAAAHSWDVARGSGQGSVLDPDVATVLYGFVQGLPLAEIRAAGEFGPEVDVAADAPAADRLLGLLGRRP